MIITEIKPQAKNKGRVSVYADGEFLCGLEKLTVLECRLHVGDEVDPERLREAVAGSEATAAFEKAASYLGARPRTEKEIHTYLSGKGYSPETVERVIGRLFEYRYLDDAEYCRIYIDTYRHKSGARKLEAELRAKGVARETVDSALEALEDQTEEVAHIAERYLRTHKPDKRKLTAYLLGKGFDYDTIKSALGNFDFSEDDSED